MPSLQDCGVGDSHEDERGALQGSNDKFDRANPRISRGRQGNSNSEVSRGRDTESRNQSGSSSRGASLNRYSKILRGRSANIDSIAYDEIVIRADSYGSSQQSSLTDHEHRKPTRSKSLIRSAIKHLGMSARKRNDQETRDHGNDNSQGTGSTITASEESSPVQWEPQSSLVISGKQLEIIDSDSDEDQSCATRSDKGPNDSITKLNTEGMDTLEYGEVFHSSEHHLFRNTMDYDDECGDLSNSSTPKESKPNRWKSIGKAIRRSRSVSVRRGKCNSDDVAKNKRKEEHPDTNRPVQQQVISKRNKLRSASLDTKKAIMKVNIGRSFSVSRISPKKTEVSPTSTLPQKKVKCIVCRQRLPRGQCVEHMGLFFCAGLDGLSCFQCAKCRCSLDHLTIDDVRVNNAQVITNSRGSVVQCGECSIASFTEPKQKKLCAICNRDFSSYNGEIQVLGEQTYHSACLKRKSMKLSGQSADLLHLETTDEPTPGDSAQCLPQKVCVKLSIQDGSIQKREYLAAIFFEWKDKQNEMAKIRENEHSAKMEKFLMNDVSSPVDLSLEIAYSLDPFAFGNPNYSGHHSSALGASHKYSPRKTSATFPVNVEVQDNGIVCTDFVADLQWIGLQNPSSLEHVSSELTIQPYPYEDSSVRKCMNQLWRYKHRGIIHEFQFSVPFKRTSLTMEINELDELDLTDSRFDVYLDIDQTQQQSEMLQDDHLAYNDSRIMIPNVPDWESRAEELIHEIDTYDFRAKPRIASKSLPPKRSKGRSNPAHQEQDHNRILDPDGEEIANFAELLSVARSGDHHAISLPKVVHINAYKKSGNEDTGLCLIESNGSSLVAEVSKSGLFSTKLTEGAVVLAINGKPVRNPRHFMRLFRDAESKVTIMASEDPPIPGCSFVVIRKEKDTLPDLELLKAHPNDTSDTLGMSFEMINGLVRITDIHPNGVFATSRIAPGDICLMVDGVPATTLHSAVRSLAFARGAVSLLTFPLSNLWRNLLDITIREEYSINWMGSTSCELKAHNKEHPIRICFDSVTGLCFEETGTESIQSDLSQINTIIERTMDMLVQSIKIYMEPSDARGSMESTTRSRSVSVSASGSLRGRSDVYRRALIKLEEMMASGKLSKQDYKQAKQALMLVAIH